MRSISISLCAVFLAGALGLAGCGKQREVSADQPALPAGLSEADKDQAMRESSLEKLMGLHMSLAMYAGDYDDKLAPSLSQLLAENYTRGEHLVVDHSGTTASKTAAEVAAGQCDFLYFGAGHSEDDLADDDPMACTKPGLLAGGCVAVLYPGGHREIHDQIPAKLQKAIAALKWGHFGVSSEGSRDWLQPSLPVHLQKCANRLAVGVQRVMLTIQASCVSVGHSGGPSCKPFAVASP